MDAVIGLAVLRLGDHALELGGDVVHDHFVQGHAGVIAAGGSLEGVVGVAAGAHKVVGDNGVGLFGVECLAAHGLDHDPVDGGGLAIGGAGIELLGVKLGAGVHGELNAGHLGEAPPMASGVQ